MSGKRVLALYGALLFCFAAVVCRLYWLCSDTAYGARAAAQSVVTLHLPARRGNFYDHRGQLLTGQTTRWMALCVPGEGSYARLFAYTDAAGQAALYQKRNAASPFLLEVDRDVSALGVSCWPAARRSSAAPLAVQLLGYLDGEGHGAAGLEAAFDDLLTGNFSNGSLMDECCIQIVCLQLRNCKDSCFIHDDCITLSMTAARCISDDSGIKFLVGIVFCYGT